MQMENELVSSEQRPKNQYLWVGPGFPTMTHLFQTQQPRWMPDTDERKNQRDLLGNLRVWWCGEAGVFYKLQT